MMRTTITIWCLVAVSILPIAAQQKRINMPQKKMSLSLSKCPILFIGVPVDASINPKEKNEWFSGLSEQYLYFRLGASNSIDIIPSEKVHTAIDSSRNPYSISVISYDKIAKEFGATHILHHTFEFNRDEKTVHYYAEITTSSGPEKFYSCEKYFNLQNFTTAMDSVVIWIFNSTGTTLNKKLLSRFFKLKTIPPDPKEMKTIGKIIHRKYASTQPELKISTEALLLIVEKNPQNLFAQYIATRLYEYSNNHEKAIEQLKEMMIIIPNYASFYSDVCRNYRLCGKYKEVLGYAAKAEKKGIITYSLVLEGARSLEAIGKDSIASKAYTIILNVNSTEIAALLFFSRQNNRNKKPDMAIEYTDRALALNPENGPAYLEKGRALMQQKKYEDAEKILTISTKHLKKTSEPTRLIGDIYLLKKDFEKAALFYDAAWKSNTNDFDLLLITVETWDKAKKPERALKLLQKAENLFPDSLNVQKMLGLFYYATGDTANTIFHLEQFLGKRKNDAQVFLKLADIYTDKGNYDKAFYLYNHAEPLLADKTIGTYSLALMYLKKGDNGAAISNLKKIIAKQPENSNAYRFLADAWFKEENFSTALKMYKKARFFEKKNPYLQKQIAAIYFELGEYNAATREYIKLLNIDNSDSDAYYYLAASYLNLKQVIKAEKVLAKGIKSGTPGSDILFIIGDGYAKILNRKKSIEYYNKCISVNSKHEKALQNLAEAYCKEKDILSAAKTYLKLYNLDNSKHNKYLAMAGLLYEQGNDTTKAHEIYRTFVTNNYDNPTVYIRFARIEYRQKNYSSAISTLEKFPSSKITEKDDMMLLADSYCSTGKPKEAIVWLEKIVSRDNKNKEALIMLGISFEKIGNIDNAMKIYKKVVGLITGSEQSTYSFKIGLLLEKSKKTIDAISTYLMNITDHPEDFRNYRQLINIYLKSENWAAAREIMEKSVGLPNAKPFYWKELAEVCLKQNDKTGAVKHYKKYLELNPNDDEAWYQLGELYFARGLYAKALIQYEKANALKQNDFTIIYKSGLAYYFSGNISTALNLFNKAYKIDSTNIEILKNLVLCFRSQNQTEKISETLKKLIKLQPENYQIKVELGCAFLELGKKSDAGKILETASKMNPKDAETHIILSSIYASTGNDNARFSHLKKALAENPENADVQCLMGKFYLEKNRSETALPYLKKALKINPDHSETIYAYSRYLFQHDKINEALIQLKKVLKDDSYNPLYLGLYARINYKLNKKNLAIKTIENALTLDSTNTEILGIAGVLFKDAGRIDEAKRILLKTISLTDKCFECYIALGEIYFEETDCAKAAGLFRRALEIKGYDEEIMMKFGRTLVLSYQIKAAKEIFERIFSTNQKQHEAFYRLAHIYFLSNDPDKVKALISRRKSIKKTVWDHLVDGEIHEIEGNIDASIISFNVGLRLQPDMPEAYAGIGRIELARENFNDAIINFSKALVRDPYNPYLLLNLGRAYEGIGQLSSAYNTYMDVTEKFPQIPETYSLIADIKSREKDHNNAVKIVLQGLKHNPENATLYSILGREFKFLGKFSNAIEAYENVIKHDKQNHLDTYLKIAAIYHLELSDEKEAKKFLKKYLKNGGDKKLLGKYDLARLTI